MSEFYNLSSKDKDGEEYKFSSLKGKVVLIVNVASKCGYTHQYGELQSLYKNYKDQGFVVLAFPCNQFGRQEPGSPEQISKFCQKTYGVTFPLMDKIDVNGIKTHPVYSYLKNAKVGTLGFKGIKWNFEKFLVDKNGNVVERFPSLTEPFSIRPTIEKLLAE